MWWNLISMALSTILEAPGRPAAAREVMSSFEEQERMSRGPATSITWYWIMRKPKLRGAMSKNVLE
jgi:hypothetical protein